MGDILTPGVFLLYHFRLGMKEVPPECAPCVSPPPQIDAPEKAMWVAMAEHLPLGFGGCQEHSVAVMSPVGSFLKDWTSPPVPLVSPPITFSLGL